MEFSIVHTELKAADIKPKESLLKYLELTEQDIKHLFSGTEWIKRECPACHSTSMRGSFDKLGFHFVRCANCFSVYANSLPVEKNLEVYYKEGISRQYWFTEILNKTLPIRKEKVDRPLCDWVERVLSTGNKNVKSQKLALLGATDYGFAQEWLQMGNQIDAINLLIPKGEILPKEIADMNLNQVRGQYDAIVTLHLLDRVVSPQAELKLIYDKLNSGGYLFITSILSTGLDNLILEKNSETLIPPDRLNSFSYEALAQLLEQNGFVISEFSTPGELDVENILREIEHLKGQTKDLFEYLSLKRCGTPLVEKLQDFLQENRLSSRARIVAVKK